MFGVQEVAVKLRRTDGTPCNLRRDLVIYAHATATEKVKVVAAVELDERHHFAIKRFSSSQSDVDLQQKKKRTQEHDRLKDTDARANNFSSLHVHYKQYSMGADIVMEFVGRLRGHVMHGVTNPKAYLRLLPKSWHADLLLLGP